MFSLVKFREEQLVKVKTILKEIKALQDALTITNTSKPSLKKRFAINLTISGAFLTLAPISAFSLTSMAGSLFTANLLMRTKNSKNDQELILNKIKFWWITYFEQLNALKFLNKLCQRSSNLVLLDIYRLPYYDLEEIDLKSLSITKNGNLDFSSVDNTTKNSKENKQNPVGNLLILRNNKR